MCYWGSLALLGTVEYCVGLYHCEVDATSGAYALARSNTVEFKVKPYTEYALFSDPRAQGSVNISMLEWTGEDIRMESVGTRAARLDPWLLAVMREEGRFTTGEGGEMSIYSSVNRYASDESISYGICPTGMPDIKWYDAVLRFVTLPLSRTRVQIWRKATISIVWPLVVYPLVAAWKRPHSGYVVLLDVLLISDIFYWAGFGLAGMELADHGGFPESSAIFVALAWLSLLSLTVHRWSANPSLLVVLASVSPLWSMFYWTPLALLYGLFRPL